MYTCYIQSFKILASFWSWAGWFESYLGKNPRRHIFAWCGSNSKQSLSGYWSFPKSSSHITSNAKTACTVNFLNIRSPKIFVVITKIWTMWLYHRVMGPNDADGMANSVDPDQTAPVWSGSALFAQTYLSENLGSLRYFYTTEKKQYHSKHKVKGLASHKSGSLSSHYYQLFLSHYYYPE